MAFRFVDIGHPPADHPSRPILTPAEAMQAAAGLDGMPGTGEAVTDVDSTMPNCVTGDTADGTCRATDPGVSRGLIFLRGFQGMEPHGMP